jgi:hypothetical protein
MIIKGTNVHGMSTTDGGASSFLSVREPVFQAEPGHLRTEAARCARELMPARVTRQEAEPSFEIAGDTGKLILVMPFEEAIDEN